MRSHAILGTFEECRAWAVGFHPKTSGSRRSSKGSQTHFAMAISPSVPAGAAVVLRRCRWRACKTDPIRRVRPKESSVRRLLHWLRIVIGWLLVPALALVIWGELTPSPAAL